MRTIVKEIPTLLSPLQNAPDDRPRGCMHIILSLVLTLMRNCQAGWLGRSWSLINGVGLKLNTLASYRKIITGLSVTCVTIIYDVFLAFGRYHFRVAVT